MSPSSKTVRGEFALFGFSLALPLVGFFGYGIYDRAAFYFAVPGRVRDE